MRRAERLPAPIGDRDQLFGKASASRNSPRTAAVPHDQRSLAIALPRALGQRASACTGLRLRGSEPPASLHYSAECQLQLQFAAISLGGLRQTLVLRLRSGSAAPLP